MARMFLSPDVNSPATIRITPWPSANRNNIIIANERFFPIAAKAIIPAKIGVEQGVPASAKVIPNKIGYIKIEFVVFCGIALIIVGVSNSRISRSFSPITNSKDAIATVKYPPIEDAKTFPVSAQAIPMSVKTIAVPSIKQQSCIKVLSGVSLEYPPTYPIIKGSIASEQGEMEAIMPPKNEPVSNKYHAQVLVSENVFKILSID